MRKAGACVPEDVPPDRFASLRMRECPVPAVPGGFCLELGLVFIIAFIQKAFKPGNDQVFFEEVVAGIHVDEAEKSVSVQACGQAAAVPALGRVRKPGLVVIPEMIV